MIYLFEWFLWVIFLWASPFFVILCIIQEIIPGLYELRKKMKGYEEEYKRLREEFEKQIEGIRNGEEWMSKHSNLQKPLKGR